MKLKQTLRSLFIDQSIIYKHSLRPNSGFRFVVTLLNIVAILENRYA